jgi:hypothetical protein
MGGPFKSGLGHRFVTRGQGALPASCTNVQFTPRVSQNDAPAPT